MLFAVKSCVLCLLVKDFSGFVLSVSLKLRRRPKSASWRALSLPFIALITLQLAFSQDSTALSSGNGPSSLPFQLGEKLYFKLYVGPMQVASGQLQVGKKVIPCHRQTCLHMRAVGKSVGIIWRRLYKVDDLWGSHFVIEDRRSSYFYRMIQENRYKKYEATTFYPQKGQATVRTYKDRELKHLQKETTYEIPPKVQDILSSYYFMRMLPFEDYLSGHIIQLPAFFEDSFYEIQIRYIGTSYVKTKLGKFKAYVISPIMPKNKLFSGKNAIKVWISADKNRVPLRAEAKMFIGSVRVELVEAKNLHYPLQKK